MKHNSYIINRLLYRKLAFPNRIFHKCLCVCLFNHSRVYRNILVSFDNPASKCKKILRNALVLFSVPVDIGLKLKNVLQKEKYKRTFFK